MPNFISASSGKTLSVFFLILCSLLLTESIAQKPAALPWVSKVGARKHPTSQKIYYVNQYGADKSGNRISTKAIQSAIDACTAKGGGIVKFQRGTYITGSIFLKKNVHLIIDKDVL